MASKDEYYHKIIASLQAEIDDLKSGQAELRKENEALKASHITQYKPQVSQQIRINAEALLKEVKRVCDEAILANYNHLPTMFADRQDFDTIRKSAEQKFLSADTFITYKKYQETRLKIIE